MGFPAILSPVKREQLAPDGNHESGGEVAELKNCNKQAQSKFSAGYWATRLFQRAWTDENGIRQRSEELAVRVQHGRRRVEVGLGTANRATAAQRAALFYRDVGTGGWDAARNRLDPERAKPKPVVSTIGDYLKEVENLGVLAPRTLAGYAYALRWFAGAILATAKDKTRFDYRKGGTKAWRGKLDALPLERLTTAAVENSMAKFVAQAGDDPLARRRASRSANSFVRNARALFGRRIRRRLPFPLPSPLPFAEVELLEEGPHRYTSTIDAAGLLQRAATTLRVCDPDAYIVILLALGAGLRRSEIAALTWPQVRHEENAIWIGANEHWKPKTATSEGLVHVSPGLIRELEAHRGRALGLFVVPGLPHHPKHGCRCDEVFRRTTAWLREQGITCPKPIHCLRREFGSIIAGTADIHTASRQLRHGDISTTARYYADDRKKVAPDIESALNGGAL
jgi:integrase